MTEIKVHCSHSCMRDVEKFVENPRNDNNHKQEHVDLLVKVFKANGIRHPIIVSKRSGFIVAGHLRLLAAKQLELESYPVDMQDFDSEAEEYKFLSSDNNVARYAEFDEVKFVDNLKELEFNISEVDFEEIGLLDFEIPEVEQCTPQGDEDSVPEIATDIIAKLGDVWLLGSHRVMCGDSTMIDSVEKLMAGEKADMVFTDPPYGINESVKNRLARNNSSLAENKPLSEFKDDSTCYAIDAFNLPVNLDIKYQVWWGANYYCHSLCEQNNWLVWDKRVEEKMHDTNSDCEMAWVKSDSNSIRIFRHLWKGFQKDSERGEARVHLTQKPIALAQWCFERYCDKSKLIVDYFLGSGSTLIACEKTKRKCYGMELDPKYCDVIIKRWQKYSGKEATLDSTGEKFNDLISD